MNAPTQSRGQAIRRRWLVAMGLAGAAGAAGLGALAYFPSAHLPRPKAALGLPLVMHEQPLVLPPLQILNEAGQPVSMASFKGKFTLLNIWATWCPPCREEMPSLDRLQAQLGGLDFQVIALSMDTGQKGVGLVRSFYASIGIKHLAIYQDADAAAIYKLKAVGVPTTLLLDRKGREIGRMSGTAEWDNPTIVAAMRTLIQAEPS